PPAPFPGREGEANVSPSPPRGGVAFTPPLRFGEGVGGRGRLSPPLRPGEGAGGRGCLLPPLPEGRGGKEPKRALAHSPNSPGGTSAVQRSGGGTPSALAKIAAAACGVTASVFAPPRMPGPNASSGTCVS